MLIAASAYFKKKDKCSVLAHGSKNVHVCGF